MNASNVNLIAYERYFHYKFCLGSENEADTINWSIFSGVIVQ